MGSIQRAGRENRMQTPEIPFLLALKDHTFKTYFEATSWQVKKIKNKNKNNFKKVLISGRTGSKQ